jgi:hypothetical protein
MDNSLNNLFDAIESMSSGDIQEMRYALSHMPNVFADSDRFHSAACCNSLLSALFICEMKSREIEHQEQQKEEECKRQAEKVRNYEEEEDVDLVIVEDDEPQKKCARCDGTGRILASNETVIKETCWNCMGSGLQPES